MLQPHPTLVPHRPHILVLGKISGLIHGLSEGGQGQIWVSHAQYLGWRGRGQRAGGCAQLSSGQACSGLMWCCDLSPIQAKSQLILLIRVYLTDPAPGLQPKEHQGVQHPRGTPRPPGHSLGLLHCHSNENRRRNCSAGSECAPAAVGASQGTESQAESRRRGPHLPPKGSGVPPEQAVLAPHPHKGWGHLWAVPALGRVLMSPWCPRHVGATLVLSLAALSKQKMVLLWTSTPSFPPQRSPQCCPSPLTAHSGALAPTEETRLKQ